MGVGGEGSEREARRCRTLPLCARHIHTSHTFESLPPSSSQGCINLRLRWPRRAHKMRSRQRATALLLALAVRAASQGNGAGTWTKTLLTDGVVLGAVCLDGSPGAYYMRAPLNDSASEGFIIYFEGGGACRCAARLGLCAS